MRIPRAIAILVLAAAVAAPASAASLQAGGLLFKTFNYEQGTGYLGDNGVYFRDANVPGYSAANPDHFLFSDLTAIIRPDGLMDGEDGWGLFNVVDLRPGIVDGEGTGITTTGPAYWTESAGEQLRGMFWGLQDQVVVISDSETVIYSNGFDFNLYEEDDFVSATDLAATDPAVARTADDRYTGWIDGTGDLRIEGIGEYFRFSGEFDPNGIPTGDAQAILSVTGGDWEPLLNTDIWPTSSLPNYTDPYGLYAGIGRTDIWQTWGISGDEIGELILSEDSGRAFVVPEPMTMATMFMAFGGLGGYLRKRRNG